MTRAHANELGRGGAAGGERHRKDSAQSSTEKSRGVGRETAGSVVLTVLTWASGGRCTATAPAGQMRKRDGFRATSP